MPYNWREVLYSKCYPPSARMYVFLSDMLSPYNNHYKEMISMKDSFKHVMPFLWHHVFTSCKHRTSVHTYSGRQSYTNNGISIPLHFIKLTEVGKVIIGHVNCKHGVPNYLILNEDAAFLSNLMQCIYKKLSIMIRTISPYNHKVLDLKVSSKLLILGWQTD